MSGNQSAGASPSSGSGRRSIRGLATALTVLLCVIAAIELIAAMTLFYRSSLLFDAAEGDLPGASEADAVDAGVAGSVVLHALLALATGVVFIVWQYRHAKNAEILGQSGGLRAGWAIGGLVLPLPHLVLAAIH